MCAGTSQARLKFWEKDEQEVIAELSEYARSQLLAHMGVKERWFSSVPCEQEADELSRRFLMLDKFRMRRLSDGNDTIIRGIVSPHYTDLPNVDVMASIVKLMPEATCVASMSMLTQRAFYATLICGKKINLPGTTLRGFPCLIVRNSEVGYTSLWAVPALWVDACHLPFVFKTPLLRRAHRGTFDIGALLNIAIDEAATWTAGLPKQLTALRSVLSFPDIDTAVDALRGMILSNNGPKALALAAERALRANPGGLTGEELLLALIAGVQSASPDPDVNYDHAQIAGAVLLTLAGQ